MITIQNVLMWLAVSAAVGALCFVLCKKGRIGKNAAVMATLCAFYMSVIITITLINRHVRKKARTKLVLFWTIRSILDGNTTLLNEVLWNIILFIPFGLMLASLLKRKRSWAAPVIGVLISSGIELSQYMMKRGLFEFDDIVYNTLGTIVGTILFYVLLRAKKRKDSKSL